MKFIIIGGDAAGMSAASKAKRHMANMDVTVLEQTDDVSYSACGMPYNIAEPDREIEDLVVRKAHIFREKQGINLLTGHRAESIDPAKKTITGHTLSGEVFQFPYDNLLIATGGSPILPDIPGIDLPGVMALKSLDDGRKIKACITDNSVKKVVIIGMGYIGLEMAEALRSRSIEVDMIKPGPVFLPWMKEELSDVVRKELEENQVGLFPGHNIDRIGTSGKQLKLISSRQTLTADMILVAIGIKPNSQLASDSGLEIGVKDAIAVDKQMRTSNEHIFAAGDCAEAYHVVNETKAWIPLALRANRAGWAVADNVCGKSAALPGIVGTAVFKVFDLEVARTGFRFDGSGSGGIRVRSCRCGHQIPIPRTRTHGFIDNYNPHDCRPDNRSSAGNSNGGQGRGCTPHQRHCRCPAQPHDGRSLFTDRPGICTAVQPHVGSVVDDSQSTDKKVKLR